MKSFKLSILKIAPNIFLFIVFILGICSLFFLIKALLCSCFYSNNPSLESIYFAIGSYDGLYKSFFICLAGWIGVEKLVQTSEENDRNIRSNTLAQCDYFKTKLENEYSLVLRSIDNNGDPVKYDKLNGRETRENLKQLYENVSAKIEELSKEELKKIRLSLNKFDQFSIKFLKGYLDMDLGGENIGSLYVKHMDSIMPFIAYYRSIGSEDFFQNILELKEKWKIYEKDD